MRRFSSFVVLALFTKALLSCSPEEETSSPDGQYQDPISLASPFLGSGGFGYNFGSAFPGALWPQGLVKVGPDTVGAWGDFNTPLTLFLHYSGYWYDDDKVAAFSHLHLHGTGATDYGVLGFMPLDGFDASRIPVSGHLSHFQKSSEHASPGSYAITLENGSIQVELTASTHVAYHRYSYPSSVSPVVLIDLTHHLSGGTIRSAEATTKDGVLRGKVWHLGGMSQRFGGYEVFFEARANRPWIQVQRWSGDANPAVGDDVQFVQPEDAKEQQPAGFALQFEPSSEPLEFQVAVSLVSAEGAANNLKAEATEFDHDAARKAAEEAWRPLVGQIEIEGASEKDQRMVASALYKLFLMPSRIEDADGSYRGIDQQIHESEGFHYCSDLSLWDTYRTYHPLLALLAPDRDLDAIRSLHAMAQQGGFFPKWPLAIGDTGTMIGASAEVVLADAFVKGITNFDAADAYERLRSAAMNPDAPPETRGGRGDVKEYMEFGYVPSSISGSVSKTVEFAINDFALSAFARALDKNDDADALAARSQSWRNLFNPEAGFLLARESSGIFSSKKYSPTVFREEYVEASGWHTLFGPLHDVEGLIELHGSREALIEKLEDFFEKGRLSYEENPADGSIKGSGMRPYFWASNEPTMHIVYLFAQAGRPDLTQKWLRWIQNNFFRPTPDGLPGNDDGGTMSAWYLFNAMGFYPVAGTDRYLLGVPTYPKMIIHLAGGDFTIEAPGVSDENIYVQSVELNGAPLTESILYHRDLHPGGSLRFSMGSQPP